MSSNGEFSEEQSEELISHLKSGDHSEFEQLRSALNLLAHVTELAPTSIPPVLPSGITQPIPLIPVKSTNPHRTFVTSVIVVAMFASASLAAAAVTGIGPAPIVNMGHETANFVKGVAGAVSHVVTGANSENDENKPTAPQVPGLTPAPTGGDHSSSNNNEGSDSESSGLAIPPLPNPLTPEGKQSNEAQDGKSKDGKSASKESSKTPHESQSPQSEDSPAVIALPQVSLSTEKTHSDNQEHATPEPSKTPRAPSPFPSPNSSDQPSDND